MRKSIPPRVACNDGVRPRRGVRFIASAVALCVGGLVVSLERAAAAVPLPQDAVIYEVNPRAFSTTGDLAGVTARLDEIQSLGVNVLWLMPIYPVGQVNKIPPLGSPYSVRDYGSVGSEYGSQADLVALVDGAHARGMSVLMDWVANHTAWDHPWIVDHRDWYAQDGQGNIMSPPGTNWTDVAELNYDNASLRSAMISEMQYWVANVGIDGFRADAADLVPSDFWAQALPAVRSATARPLFMLAEGSNSSLYTAGFDASWGFGFYDTLQSVFNQGASARLIKLRSVSEFAQAPAGKSILRFTTNHDESAFHATPPELFGGLDASLAAYASVIAYGGTPLVYDGQEIGWSQNIPIFSKSALDWSTGATTRQWYSDILQIRQTHPALQEGTYDDQSSVDVAMVLRQTTDDQVLCVVNTRNAATAIAVPAAWQSQWYDQFTQQAMSLPSSLSLAPYQVLLLAKAPLLPGDFNFNEQIDGSDFLKWQRGASPNPLSVSDLAAWQNGFGPPAGDAAVVAAQTPEPSATALCCSAGTIVCLWKKSRCLAHSARFGKTASCGRRPRCVFRVLTERKN